MIYANQKHIFITLNHIFFCKRIVHVKAPNQRVAGAIPVGG